MTTSRLGRSGISDTALALTLGCGIALYLASLPRTTVGTDEATYLKEALRILRGQVLYRDIFDLTTPGWMYLMAALFKVFGSTFGTARVTAAVIQGLTSVAVFATCRSIGVRREIGLAVALLCPLSAELNYPLASQHWLATLLSTAILLSYIRYGQSNRGLLATGLILGVLISVHQQRGASIALGAAGFVVGDALLRRALGYPFDGRSLARRLIIVSSSAAAVVIPVLGLTIWQAGFHPVWRALVLFPLVEYRGSTHCRWGHDSRPGFLPGQILRFLPLILLLVPLRTLAVWRQIGDPQRLRAIMILMIHCGASILSIWYYPDRIHIAFIVPTFAVIGGDLLEWLLGPHPLALNARPDVSVRTRQIGTATGYLLALSVIASIAIWGEDHFSDRWRKFRYSYHGPFGRIDLPNLDSVQLFERIDELLQTVPGRTLYCHGLTTYHCLFVDGRNPTRYELLVNFYNSPAQIAEVTQVLTITDVPYVIALPAAVKIDDQIGAFIRRNYRQLDTRGVDRYIWKHIPGRNQLID